jgi:hypothetical protein
MKRKKKKPVPKLVLYNYAAILSVVDLLLYSALLNHRRNSGLLGTWK